MPCALCPPPNGPHPGPHPGPRAGLCAAGPTRLRRPAARGFTLVELVVVMVLLGVLAAVAGPRFAGTSPFTQRRQADMLLSTLRLAQSTAVARRATVHVKAVASTGRLDLCVDTGCATPITNPEGGSGWLQLDASLRFAADATWSYDAAGAPSFATATTLALSDSGGTPTGFAVRIEPYSGHARLQTP